MGEGLTELHEKMAPLKTPQSSEHLELRAAGCLGGAPRRSSVQFCPQSSDTLQDSSLAE